MSRIDELGGWPAVLTQLLDRHDLTAVQARTAMGTILFQDLPPYVTAAGNSAKPHGLNVEGLKRRGFKSETLAGLRAAYKTLYKSGLTLEEAKMALTEQCRSVPEVALLLEFVTRSRRGIVR